MYVYSWCPPKTYVHLTFAGICNIVCLFLVAFWSLVFLGYRIYIYIFVHVGCMTCLSTLEGMHSECVQCIQNAFLIKTKIQDPRFPQDSWQKSWKNQDPRSKIPTRLLAKILEKPRSKIPTRLLAKILEIPRSKIQDSHKTPG